jgi:hypothetical protein
MATGYGANSAHIISADNLIKVVGDENLVNEFIRKFNGYKFTEHEVCDREVLAQTLSLENPGDIDTDRQEYKTLNALWDEISGKFTNETNISIWPEYHDKANEGDCHDMVDGLYFSVSFGDIYKPTEEYTAMQQKYGDIIDDAFFVHYG